mmetsp:Transcript_44490/g.111686  ORF Transcript_44490/g.111686 Transcript_44490/m.111686 type:complete len:208 (-) Transcript_44490:419-1042(-)
MPAGGLMAEGGGVQGTPPAPPRFDGRKEGEPLCKHGSLPIRDCSLADPSLAITRTRNSGKLFDSPSSPATLRSTSSIELSFPDSGSSASTSRAVPVAGGRGSCSVCAAPCRRLCNTSAKQLMDVLSSRMDGRMTTSRTQVANVSPPLGGGGTSGSPFSSHGLSLMSAEELVNWKVPQMPSLVRFSRLSDGSAKISGGTLPSRSLSSR